MRQFFGTQVHVPLSGLSRVVSILNISVTPSLWWSLGSTTPLRTIGALAGTG